MKAMYRIALLSILMAGCAGSPQVSESSKNITVDEYGERLMHFFENKNDEIIYDTINLYKYYEDDSDELDMMDSIVIFFFYGIKTDDNARYNNFRKIADDNKAARLINIFEILDRTDMAAFLDGEDASPDLTDVYWTLYYSSGNTNYLDRIIKTIMDHNNETANITYYLAASSAMWSLSSNMRMFPSVWKYVEDNTVLSSNIKEYIHNDPDKIQTDAIQFINEQRRKGIW